MRAALLAVGAAACLAALSSLPSPLPAADVPIRVVVHPHRAARMTRSEVRAIYLKRKLFWADGQPIIPINREAGSAVRETFSERIFGQGSRRLAGYWNQRYFEAGEFPPGTLASEEAVIRFVAGNENAIGYVTREDVGDGVAVVLDIPKEPPSP
jgi:ABC-type phosphate transport system substrate-binding protein